MDCYYKYDQKILILILIPSILITLLAVEMMFWWMSSDPNNLTNHSKAQKYNGPIRPIRVFILEDDVEMIKVEKSVRGVLLDQMRADDDEVDDKISQFLTLLLDKENWDLGVRDDTNLLKPYYHEGGFDTEKMREMHELYRDIRSSNMHSGLRYILYTVKHRGHGSGAD